MKDFWKYIAYFVLAVFALVVIGIGLFREFHLMTILSPGDLVLQILSLFLFTGGMIVWTILLFKGCHSIIQYAIAAVSSVVGLVLTVAAATADIWFRQTLINRPGQFSEMVIWLLVGSTAYYMIALWIFHVGDPRIIQGITEGMMDARLMARTYKRAEEKLDAQLEEVANRIADGRVARLTQSIEERERVHEDAGKQDTPRPISSVSNPAPHPEVEHSTNGHSPKA